MMAGSDDEKVYPKARHVVEVMDAAAGATEDEVLGCLSYLRDERGLKPGTRSGPRHFSFSSGPPRLGAAIWSTT